MDKGCNFYHIIFHKMFTKFGKLFLFFFVTFKSSINFEKKITYDGEKYFNYSNIGFKNCGEIFITQLLTKFCDSLKFSPKFEDFFLFTSDPMGPTSRHVELILV